MPQVSILTPVYNAEATLKAMVTSIRRQTEPDWELILVDDASTDGSAALCDRLAAEDPRIHVCHLPQNGGAGPARNAALALATGDYVVMIDADDTEEPTMLEEALAALRRTGADTVVWGLTEEFADENGVVTRRRPVPAEATFCDTPDTVHRALLELERRTLFGYCANKLYRREILLQYGITSPNEPLYEDFLFNAAYAPHIRALAVLPTAPHHYYKRSGSLTSRFVPRYFSLSQLRVRTMWELCVKWGIADDAARRLLGDIYARYIFSALSRHNDPRMAMSAAARRTFLKDLYTEPLFRELIPHAAGEGAAMRLLYGLLRRRCTGLCLLAGRAAYWLRILKQ